MAILQVSGGNAKSVRSVLLKGMLSNLSVIRVDARNFLRESWVFEKLENMILCLQKKGAGV